MNSTLILYLGLDYMRGILFDENGCERAAAEVPVGLIASDDFMEQDPGEWMDGINRIIKDIQCKDSETVIENMSVIYQPGTFVFVDRSGRHVMGAVMPCDKRARRQAEICEKMFRKQSQDFYVPWSNSVFPIIMWIKYNKPDIYKKIYKILTPDGYLSYRLCGETAIDNYSAYFMGYSLKSGEYNNKILNALGIENEIFPKVCKVGDCIGIVGGSIKEELGLSADSKFIMGSNCILPMAVISNIGDSKNIVFDSETFNICFVSNNIKTRKHNSIIRIPFKDEMYIYCISGSYQRQFANWIKKMAGCIDSNDIKYTPGSNGVIILPEILGNRENDYCDINGCILGISHNNTVNDLVTSFYETAGFIIKNNIEHIMDKDMQIDSIEVIGENRNILMCRILSNINSRKVLGDNSPNHIMKIIHYMVNNKEIEENEDKFEAMPEEEGNFNYKQLLLSYNNSRNCINNIYKYRRKVLRKQNSNHD